MKRMAALLLLACTCAVAADRFERISPIEAGYDAAQLAQLPEFLSRRGSESLLLLHDGRVFFEWGDIHRRRLVHSMRKALLNALVGRCVASGRLDLDASLQDLGIDDTPPGLDAVERSAKVLHLLQSRSGIYHPAAAESDAMQAAKPPRGTHPPGSHWHYNNWDFNAAATVLEQACGPLYEAFDRDIARPLGMLDWRGRIGSFDLSKGDAEAKDWNDLDGFYQLEPGRSRHAAYHFRLSAHDLALYGQLYLQGGRWGERQLVPADWIRRSTQPVSVVDARWGLAYGWLWDVLIPAQADAPAAFFHTGLDVHMLGVYTAQGLVLVHRVDTEGGSRFTERDLLELIRRVHGARLPVTTKAARDTSSN